MTSPLTVMLVTWRFSGDPNRLPMRFRIVMEPKGDDAASYPAFPVIEVADEDALGASTWYPWSEGFGGRNLGPHSGPDGPTILRCALGRLPEMVLAGQSKRPQGELPAGWRIVGSRRAPTTMDVVHGAADDILEIDCGTFECEP